MQPAQHAAPDLYTLSSHIAQAQAVAATLHHAAMAQTGTPSAPAGVGLGVGLDAATVADCAALMVSVLRQAQDAVSDLYDYEILPVPSFEALHKVRALQEEIAREGCAVS